MSRASFFFACAMLCFLQALGVLNPADALANTTALPLDVQVIGTRWQSDTPPDLPVTGPRDASESRALLATVLASGRYANAWVEHQARRTVLFVEPRRIIARLETRNAPISPQELLSSRNIELGSEVTSATLDAAQLALQAWLNRKGFPDARVSLELADTDRPLDIVLIIDISAQARRTIAERAFVVPPGAAPAAVSVATEYALEPGDLADEDQLDSADRSLQELLRSRGFWEASINHALHPTSPSNHTEAVLSVLFHPGPEHIIMFRGAKRFTQEQLLEAITGDHTEHDVGFAVQTTQTLYRQHGYLDAVVTAAVHNPSAQTRNIVIQITEGKRSDVGRRVFSCLPSAIQPQEAGALFDAALEERLPEPSFEAGVATGTVGKIFGTNGRASLDHDPNPKTVFDPGAYGEASKALRTLLRDRGYPSAEVDAPAVLRSFCQGDTCQARPPSLSLDCSQASEAPLPAVVGCAPPEPCHPVITTVVRVRPGPEAHLGEIVISGGRAIRDPLLRAHVALVLRIGAPVSVSALESARERLLTIYRDAGHPFAEVDARLDLSIPSKTRAVFSVREHPRVTIDGFVIQGNLRTDERLIRSRIALESGGPFRESLARKTEEQLAGLGVFSTAQVTLENPEIIAARKRVLILVTEGLPQHVDVRPGFSAGDGVRLTFEYGHGNLGGIALALGVRLQLGYLFEFMIVDPDVRRAFASLPVRDQLERRASLSFEFRDIALGPWFSASIEGFDLRDNQRDFGITKDAGIPSLHFRPIRGLHTMLSGSVERNDIQVFDRERVEEAAAQNASLRRLLLAPEGLTLVTSEGLSVTWDRRNHPLLPMQGMFASAHVDHVQAFPLETTDDIKSQFLRLRGRVSGYVPIVSRRLSLALSLEAGHNLQLTPDSRTYPDRLFFLGGVDSVRSFLADSIVPQDLADRILHPRPGEDISVRDVGVRGGDFALNPRSELRLSITSLFLVSAFVDAGNLWVDPDNIDPTILRYAAGAGLRLNLPVGPLAIDYGFNLNRRPWEDIGAFHFSVGVF